MAKKSLSVIRGACSRRSFLEAVGATAAASVVLSACATNSGAGAAGAVTQACGTNTCIDLTNPANKALTLVNGALTFDTASDVVLVVRVSATEVIAVSAICTHAGCEVGYDGSQRLIACPCHGSEFGTDGHVIHGPAPSPLQAYPATLVSNMITVMA